jgi:hypothetical protein
MVSKRGFVAIALLWLPFIIAAGWAQESDLALDLRKDFGFSMGGRIQGRFTVVAHGPGDLRRVDFFIDGAQLEVDIEVPFEAVFRTDDFDPGIHYLSAVAQLESGEELRSMVLELQFVSADEGWRSALNLLVLLGFAVAASAVLSFLVVRLGGSSKPEGGSYGIAGGAVCPNCGAPFPRHLLSPNLIVGKIERCPSCRKWSLVARASAEELVEARERQAGELQTSPSLGAPESERRRMLEDSRFIDER